MDKSGGEANAAAIDGGEADGDEEEREEDRNRRHGYRDEYFSNHGLPYLYVKGFRERESLHGSFICIKPNGYKITN